jgi:hypothetical protein
MFFLGLMELIFLKAQRTQLFSRGTTHKVMKMTFFVTIDGIQYDYSGLKSTDLFCR